jgi:hypothetical protein
MDLDNMRSLGVTNVDAYCRCGASRCKRHQASIDVSSRRDGRAIDQEPAAVL